MQHMTIDQQIAARISWIFYEKRHILSLAESRRSSAQTTWLKWADRRTAELQTVGLTQKITADFILN